MDRDLSLDGGDIISPTPRRSATRWMLLLLVWCTGLAVWALYLVVIFYLLLKLP
jgi:hypothetical protein